MKYLNIIIIYIVAIIIGKFFMCEIFLLPLAILAVVLKVIERCKLFKVKSEKNIKIDGKIKRLICLSICFLLFLSVDSYYRESKNPYNETDLESHLVAESEEKTVLKTGIVTVYDIKNLKFGDYYKICYMNGANGWNIFRIPKENQIEYGIPSVLKNEYGYEVTIKREGMDDLVYVMPY